MKVLTYNIRGLPLPGEDHSRYAEIGRDLAQRRARGDAPDVVAIQEAFHRRTRDIQVHSGYPYSARGPKGSILKIRSGLLILSEHPLENLGRIAFRECISWDCFARKGAMHLRVHVPGMPQPVDLYNTHLNSDPEMDRVTTVAQTRQIRSRQLDRLVTFLARSNPARGPAIFPGDFNFPGTDPELPLFSLRAGLEDAARTCATLGSCEGDGTATEAFTESLDHLFYASGAGMTIEPIAIRSVFTRPVDGRMLSDHFGREVDFLLSW